MRGWIAVLILLATGCPSRSPELVREEAARLLLPTRSPQYQRMVEIARGPVREGELQTEREHLLLYLRAGDRRRLLLRFPRAEHAHGCHTEATEGTWEGMSRDEESTWWIFHDADDAMALEFGDFGVTGYFWDDENDCVVSLPAFPEYFPGAPPGSVFGADDTPLGVPATLSWDYPAGAGQGRVHGDRELEIVQSSPGPELVVVDRDLVSIESSDGRALFRMDIEPPTESPCPFAEVATFRRADGVPYVVASLEAEAEESCKGGVGEASFMAYVVAIWNEPSKSFRVVHRQTERYVSERVGGPWTFQSTEDVVFEQPEGRIVKHLEHEIVNTFDDAMRCLDRDGGSGVCLHEEGCSAGEQREENRTRWTFVGDDGVAFTLGTGKSTMIEAYDGCQEF